MLELCVYKLLVLQSVFVCIDLYCVCIKTSDEQFLRKFFFEILEKCQGTFVFSSPER